MGFTHVKIYYAEIYIDKIYVYKNTLPCLLGGTIFTLVNDMGAEKEVRKDLYHFYTFYWALGPQNVINSRNSGSQTQ